MYMYPDAMGLGTSYPASPTSPPPKPPPSPSTSPGAGGGPRGQDNTGGYGSPVYGPSSTNPTGSPGAGGGPRGGANSDPRLPNSTDLVPLDPYQQAIADFNAINTAQQGDLMTQYLNAMGLGQGIYDNNVWYRNAQAANDLARLDIGQQRDVGLGQERNNLNRQFAGRAFDIDSRGNALTRDMRYRANDSEAAGRGSITSFGYGQNNRDILGQYGVAQDTTQLSYDRAMADAQLDDKALDLVAQEYGIKRSDINNALKYGLTQLGLDQAQATLQLNQALTSGNAQLQQNAINFLMQIMALPLTPVSMADLGLNLDMGTVNTPAPPTPNIGSAGTGGSGSAGGGGGGGGQPLLYQ